LKFWHFQMDVRNMRLCLHNECQMRASCARAMEGVLHLDLECGLEIQLPPGQAIASLQLLICKTRKLRLGDLWVPTVIENAAFSCQIAVTSAM
jgi:hypothetical protein